MIHQKTSQQRGAGADREQGSCNYVDEPLPPFAFHSKKQISAAGEKEEESSSEVDIDAANRGTVIHKIIELYWERFRGQSGCYFGQDGHSC